MSYLTEFHRLVSAPVPAKGPAEEKERKKTSKEVLLEPEVVDVRIVHWLLNIMFSRCMWVLIDPYKHNAWRTYATYVSHHRAPFVTRVDVSESPMVIAQATPFFELYTDVCFNKRRQADKEWLVTFLRAKRVRRTVAAQVTNALDSRDLFGKLDAGRELRTQARCVVFPLLPAMKLAGIEPMNVAPAGVADILEKLRDSNGNNHKRDAARTAGRTT